MRKKILAANWKMNMTCAEAWSFLDSFLLEIGDEKQVEVVIVPPFTALAKAGEILASLDNVLAEKVAARVARLAQAVGVKQHRRARWQRRDGL